MRPLNNRIRMRRLHELLFLTLFVVIVLTVGSKWTSSPKTIIVTANDKHMNIKINPVPANPFLPREKSFDFNDNSVPERLTPGSDNLAKYIHLDLKGAPPQANQFYENFFNFVDKLQMGVKGVLIEYEDMLPLEGRLENTTHRLRYSKSDIELIQTAARSHQLDVIPLIQTFGHLEWLLKLQQFELYRDDLNMPMVITPCVNNTYILLEDLLKQTLDMHPYSNIIHIGCDEVVLTNSHPQCRETWVDASQRYVDHVKRVVSIVRKHRPAIRILIWDDVIRGDQFLMNEKLLDELKGLVEPVAWNYRPTFDESYISSPVWNIYSKLFSTTWAASAFKGGLSRYSMQTNTTHHVLNNRAWLRFLQSLSPEKRNSFSAIILTGWSRFDHFMPLCDLLPTAYQSLVSTLYTINTGKVLPTDYINDCDGLMNFIEKDATLCQSLPGLSLWSDIATLASSLAQIEERLTFLHTVAPLYNRKHRFVRRYELDMRLNELQVFQNDITAMIQPLSQQFAQLYSLDVIDEWFDLYVSPVLTRINSTLVEFASARNQTSWPRRPLI